MRIIITGGTGLIGRALAADLAGDNHEVIVLSRRPEKAANLPTGMRAERWDARTAEGWGALADGADAIVNLAGEPISGQGFIPSRWTAERKRRIRESRLNAGRAVAQAVESASSKPGVVVQSSGAGYYGPHGDEEVTIENPIASGPFNLTAPNLLTNAEFSRVIGRVLRRPAFVPVPAFALRLLFGEMSTVLLEGQKAISRRLQELGFTFRFPEAEAALRDLLQ